MKKQRLTLFVSALLALGLASCGGESSPEPASTPETPASTASKSDTKTTTSKSTTSKSSTSKSTSQAPVERPYISLPFDSYAEAPNSVDDQGKWKKGASFTYTFWTSRAEEGVTVALGVKMSSSSHSDRTLFTDHNNASSQDQFESNEANDGTPRLALENNGVAYPLTNHKTYGECGLNTDDFVPLELGEINVKKGKNVVKITTHASTGYRLLPGGDCRLLYQVGEADLQGQEVIPTTTISSVAIAAEEEHAYLVYNVDYQNGDFDDVKAMDWQADFEGTTNGGGREWKYQAAADQVLSYADGGEGKLKVKVLLDNLPVNNYWSRFGLGVQPESAGGNAGKANETRFTGEAAAYEQTVTVGTRTYEFKADGGQDSYNLPFLKVSDSAEPIYEISEVGMSQVNNRAIVTWTIDYSNYTLAEIQALDWQAAFQENDNVAHKGWDWIEYGVGKDNEIAVVDAGVEGKAKIEIDVTEYDLNCYMGFLGVGLRDKDGGQHAYECKPALGQNSSFQIGNKLYEFMPKGINDTFGLPTLFINHAHVYEDASRLLNSADKPVTLRACDDDNAKQIAINFSDYTAISQTPDGTNPWYLKKGSNVTWNVSVDKAITGAVIEFGMIATSSDHLGRHLYNEAKEDALHVIPDTDPVEYEEGYVKQNTAGTPDTMAQADWRVSVAVGEQEFPITNRKTMAENGAVQNQVCYIQLASIDLAAGDNVIKLSQNDIGYRMKLNGEVRIYFNGDATITGEVPPHEHAWVAGEAKVNCYQKSNPQYTCECGEKKSEMAFGDYDDLSGTADKTNPWKFKSGAVVLWTIFAEAAGEAVFHVGMAGSTNNASSNFDPSKYVVKANDVAGTIIPELQTYGDMGLDCKGTTLKDVAFASVTLIEGWNVIELDVNNNDFRCYFGGTISLVYQGLPL